MRDARIPTSGILDTRPSPYLMNSGDYKAELARDLFSAWELARSEIGHAQGRGSV